MSLLAYFTLGLLLVVAALTIGFVSLLVTLARTGKFPPAIVIAPGAAARLVGIAMTGNVDALLSAAVDSFHLHLATGSLQERLMQAGLAEVQRNINDPNGKTPLVDAIALFTGKTRQQVFDLFKS